MKFWTYQKKTLVDEMLQNEGTIIPDFSEYEFDNEYKPKAYYELLKYYNSHMYKPVNGLIFGIVSTDVCQIDEPKDLVNFWIQYGSPGGIVPSPEEADDYYLLCVEIEDDQFLAPLRFYDFSDMMFFLREGTKEEEKYERELIPKIFLPDPGCAIDIVQSHIPAIFYDDHISIFKV